MGCRPDVLGWRRDKHGYLPKPDARGVVTAVPDWICEVLSPSTSRVDVGEKRVGYHLAGVPHYWLADPSNGTLTALQWTAEGYLWALTAGPGDRVRVPPFADVEIDVSALFGDAADAADAADATEEAPATER
jgi:Uma2 family endonuclease